MPHWMQYWVQRFKFYGDLVWFIHSCILQEEKKTINRIGLWEKYLFIYFLWNCTFKGWDFFGFSWSQRSSILSVLRGVLKGCTWNVVLQWVQRYNYTSSLNSMKIKLSTKGEKNWSTSSQTSNAPGITNKLCFLLHKIPQVPEQLCCLL